MGEHSDPPGHGRVLGRLVAAARGVRRRDKDSGMFDAARIALIVIRQRRHPTLVTGLEIDGLWQLHIPYIGICRRAHETQLRPLKVTSPLPATAFGRAQKAASPEAGDLGLVEDPCDAEGKAERAHRGVLRRRRHADLLSAVVPPTHRWRCAHSPTEVRRRDRGAPCVAACRWSPLPGDRGG